MESSLFSILLSTTSFMVSILQPITVSKPPLLPFLPLLFFQHKKVTLFLSYLLPHVPFFTCFHLFSQTLASREDRDELVRSSSHTPANKAQILAMPQFGLRDNLIRCELLKNEEQYTYLEDFRYFTVHIVYLKS